MGEGHRITEIQRKFFAILAEFFKRATTCSPTSFATFDSFGSRIRSEAQKLAPRLPDAYSYAHEALGSFYHQYGVELFTQSKSLGGLSFVLGGGTRFGESQFDSVRKVALYADTVLIPDPIMPWIEDPRSEERFRHVLFLETAFALLHLKPLVDADLPYPAVVVFPSYEKSLERSDRTTQDRINRLVLGILSHYLGRDFSDFEDLHKFSIANETEFLTKVDEHHLLVAPNGSVGEPLLTALNTYIETIKEWRSDDHVGAILRLPRGAIVLNALMERIAPQSHLLENAEELSCCPMLCFPSQWHYYSMSCRFFEEQLKACGALNEQTIKTVRAINQPDLNWLGNVPVEALVDLRRNNENEQFRRSLKERVSELHGAAVSDLDRITSEVSRSISSLLAAHDKQIATIEEKYSHKYRNIAIGSWITVAAALVPALAPFLGVSAPIVLGGQYLDAKISERKDRAKAACSLMGVLAAAKETGGQ